MGKAGRIGSFQFLKSQQWCSSNLSLRFDAGSGLDPSRVNYSPIFGDKPVKFEAVCPPKRDCGPEMVVNPFRAAVPFWGQTSQIPSNVSPIAPKTRLQS